MGKPRVKLRAVSSRQPPTASREQKAARMLAELAPLLKMSVDEIRREPHKARARREALERVCDGGSPTPGDVAWMFPGTELSAEMAAALKMTAQQFAQASQEDIERRLEQMKKEHIEKVLGEEHARVIDIVRACEVTGEWSPLMRLVRDGAPADRAVDHIFDVAAARSDGQAINNAHSPEGGHSKAIDHAAIYARQNARKERRA